MNYYFSKTLNEPFATVKERTLESLKKQGFGVLTEIDIQATLKNKIDADFHRYEILGACNPKLAYQALQAEDKIGTMLPCNLIIQQKQENGPIEVAAVNPIASMQSVENPSLQPIASEVETKLKTVIEQI